MKIKTTPREKLFSYDLIKPIELTAEIINGKRFYSTPEGNKYHSVTTVLSSLDKGGIKKWVERVGEEKANRIKTQAATRGTKVHEICENYLLNQDSYLLHQMPSNISLFKQIQPFLDTNIDVIHGIEIALYSDVLKTAGRCDLFCTMNGLKTIADFKTSTNVKEEGWIENYFLQTTAYSLMVEELYGIPVEQICIMIAVENGEFQSFTKSPKEFKERVLEVFLNYSS
jgi:hypothetical protein